MRAKKFRVYIPEDQKFTYFELGNFDYPDRYLHQHSHEVQQSSGLKDTNGVEIYEGDIVKLTFPSFDKIKNFFKGSENTLIPLIKEKMEGNTYTGKVFFDDCGGGILGCFGYYVGFIPFFALKSLVVNNGIEVVGNTTENNVPEA